MNSIIVVAIIFGSMIAIVNIIFNNKNKSRANETNQLSQETVEELNKLLDKLEDRISALETIVINQKDK